MPAKLKVRVFSARDLPVMDRASELTDAFVEVKFMSVTYKTEVCHKSLSPVWNSDWFKFEVDDEDLQDEPLQIKVLDHDTYSSHDAIGKIYIDLNPLLSKDSTSVISGWFPIYDTMHGIRGELNLIVKVDLFSDFNKFRQSSCGVPFFCTSGVPYGYRVQAMHGFVEELVVNDDPEYQWIDKIRSQRASNEARQIQFSKLSGELQRKIGLKVLGMGGNSVIGYQQYFDLEGESGIVVRAVATAVTLTRQGTTGANFICSGSPLRDVLLAHSGALNSLPSPGVHGRPPLSASPLPVSASPIGSWLSLDTSAQLHHRLSLPDTSFLCDSPVAPYGNTPTHTPKTNAFFSSPVPEDAVIDTSSSATVQTLTVDNQADALATNTTNSVSPAKSTNRRSSESDVSTPPKVGLSGSSGSNTGLLAHKNIQHPLNQQQPSIELMEYPFFTMRSFPLGFLVYLGGVVSARSVKLLDRIHNPDEPETRDAWWMELRTEIKSHAKTMGCHAVIGYTENTAICDELIILSASGTAAVVNLSMELDVNAKPLQQLISTEVPETETGRHTKLHVDVNLANRAATHHMKCDSDSPFHMLNVLQCSICHTPYRETSLPFPTHLTQCAVCHQSKVPDVLFTTIELAPEIPTIGTGSLVQARICRAKKDSKGEANAKEISDSLPFMEYELHNQLLKKLKIRGMNSLFGLKIRVAVGDEMLIALATGTAIFLAPLPSPSAPKFSQKTDDASIQQIHTKILDQYRHNCEVYGLNKQVTNQNEVLDPGIQNYTGNDATTELTDFDPRAANKEPFYLEVDDLEDIDIMSLLVEPPCPDGFYICNTESIPCMKNTVCNLQMFTHVWRGQIDVTSAKSFSLIFDFILRNLFFKLRSFIPAVLSHVDFDVDLHDHDQLQLSITGMCTGLGEVPTPNELLNIATNSPSQQQDFPTASSDHDEMIFSMDSIPESQSQNAPPQNKSIENCKPSSSQPSKTNRKFKYHKPSSSRHGVDLTPLSYIPGGRIEQYLGHLNFFIIRETTSVREIGGLNGFMHSFLSEVMAICRAHVSGLNGNALVAYRLSECVLDDNLHKNQSQCLVNVCGDVVMVHYPTDLNLSTGSSSGLQANQHDINLVKKVTPRESPKDKSTFGLRHSPKVVS